MFGKKVYSFHKGLFSYNALDFSKHSSFVKELILEKIYPTKIIVPMKQNYGMPAIPTVSVGDKVCIGQCIGVPAKGSFAIPVHSGVSGTVKDIRDITLPNGIKTAAVEIICDMKREKHESLVQRKDTDLSGNDLIGIVRDAGICGMGGEGIPTFAKLARARQHVVSELLVNCLQSEPFATSDLMVVSEYPKYVVMGAAACARCCGAKKVRFLISEKRKLEQEAIRTAIDNVKKDYGDLEFTIDLFKDRFPQGYYRLVARALYGVDMGPEDTLEETCGALMFNCSTVCACWEAVADNIPMMSRVVTVTDDAGNGHNVLVPIGTPVKEVLNTVNNTVETGSKIIWGNAFTGISIDNTENVPITKTTSAVTVIRKLDTPRTPCIHCGLCVENCPMSLSPNIIYEMLFQGMEHKASKEGARNCISCGTCSYVCPAGIDLTGMIARFANEGRIIEENSLLHNGRFQYDKKMIGDLTLLEQYNKKDEHKETYDDDSIILPFEGGKKV